MSLFRTPASYQRPTPGGCLVTPRKRVLTEMATRLAMRVLIADDNLAVRDGLRSLLMQDPAFEVVGAAVDGSQASRMALELKPDLILLDNSMPGMTGLEVSRMLRANLPDSKIVFITLDPEVRDRALATGAVAYISKSETPQEIMRQIRAAAGVAATSEINAQPVRAAAPVPPTSDKGHTFRTAAPVPPTSDQRDPVGSE